MKYKLKDIDPVLLKYNQVPANDKLYNIEYCGTVLEFQTPKVVLQEIIKENGKEYLSLKLVGTEACKTFYRKILALEQQCEYTFNGTCIKSIFKNDHFLVKVPFIKDSVQVKVHDRERLCNYYHLPKGSELICLLGCYQIWISDGVINYTPHVKEILVC